MVTSLIVTPPVLSDPGAERNANGFSGLTARSRVNVHTNSFCGSATCSAIRSGFPY